ncbi:MAG: LacI family DNA-binding transcriptional regulator, partial [Lentisphaeria bacterium]|nr:LacI family DNA-binding transcriptional regulator [Lentisphaeria bacterium]
MSQKKTQRNISIVDVAERAGFSISTVSLVMNNRPNVAAETADAIWKAVRELGYKPGANGKKRGPKAGVRRAVTGTPRVLLIVLEEAQKIRDCPLQNEMLMGIEKALRKRMMELLLRCCPTDDQAREFIRDSKADGVIVFGNAKADGLVDLLHQRACVQILGPPPPGNKWDHVSTDHFLAGSLAARHLIQKGASQIACIGACASSFPECRNGFEAAADKAKVPFSVFGNSAVVNQSGGGVAMDGEIMGSLVSGALAQNTLPKGLFVECSSMLSTLFRALRAQGVEPGRDMACVTCHRPAICSDLEHRAVPAVCLHLSQIGEQAADQVAWRIGHRNEPRVRRLVSPSLRIDTESSSHFGESVGW